MSNASPVNLHGLRTATYAVADLARAKAWYTELLGFGPYFDEPFYVGFNVAGYELGLTPEADAGGRRAEAGIAYWGVTDAEAAFARVLAMGAAVKAPLQDVGDGIKIGAVWDPFGNVFGLIENPGFRLPVP